MTRCTPSRVRLFHTRLTTLAAAACAGLVGCAQMAPQGAPAAETVFAVTDNHALIRFNAGQPGRVLDRKPITGLAPGDALVGIDYRVARGVLYALGRSGQLYTLDTSNATLVRVGGGAPAGALRGQRFGIDFNPVADRLRVVSDSGLSLRLHPDTGAMMDGDLTAVGLQPDAALSWAEGDASASVPPALLAAAYTYNKQSDKLTTNFAIDRRGLLVVQGSREGAVPVVSPNSGRLSTIGALGTGALDDAAFDIADVSGAAYAALRSGGSSGWYRIDLTSGRATRIGAVADGGPLRGIAIEP